MTEQVKTKPERTPEQQATHDKENQMKDPNEDTAFEQFCQKMLDAKSLKEEVATVEGTPKDERFKVLFNLMAAVIPPPLVPEVMFVLARVAIAAKTGELKPDQIPDIPEELAVVAMRTVARASLDELKNGGN